MRFHRFLRPTAGAPAELERALAGQRGDHSRRALDEIGRIARVADDAGYEGLGFTEHHSHIEGFEISTNALAFDARHRALRRAGDAAILMSAPSPTGSARR